jgi:phospholipid transport system substrate-binding protein
MMNPQIIKIAISRKSMLYAFSCIADSPRRPEPCARRLVKSITRSRRHPQEGQDIQAGDAKRLPILIETKIVPHFNFVRMTRIAMARNWRLASPEQQRNSPANSRRCWFGPIRPRSPTSRPADRLQPLRAKPEDTEVTVRSDVKPSGSSQPVSIDYEMEKDPNGWKVYDVKVGGVSLVTTYRDTFASEVREHGVDGLIKSLAAKNRQPEGSKAGKT